MFKIFNKLRKRTNIKHCFYDEKEWKKVIKQLEKQRAIKIDNSLVSRPLEGEIVRINNIKVPYTFKAPNKQKLQERKEYYNKYKYFKNPLVLDKQNYIVDGYTTYLLALNMGFSYITIQRDK